MEASMDTATGPGNAPGQGSASLYVGDLTPEVTEALLFERFNAVGPVASVRVCRDAATRRSLGYAYINFHRVEDAERALDTMNFVPIRKQPCRIMWSRRDPALRKSGVGNIFVKNLAKTIDNKSLYDTFSMFGNILSCKVSTSPSGETLGYGFVHYESQENALNAIKRVDGKVIAGKQVNVGLFKPKEQRPQREKFTNVYVKNVPTDWDAKTFVETFSAYGVVTSNLLVFDQDGKNKGFGFINYADDKAASDCVANLHGKDVGLGPDKKLHVCRAQKKDERERKLRQHFERLKLQRQSQYSGVNLYVKNLSDNTDDAKLRADFAKFGEVTSAKVMQKNGKSRGFGFVCFTTPENATRAVTETNGQMVEGKPLYVALAQRKDVRRSQLEAQFSARAKMGQTMQMRPPPYARPPPQVMGQPMFYQPSRVMPYGQPGVMPYGQPGVPHPGVPGHPGHPGMHPGVHPGMHPGMHPGVAGQMMRQPYQLMPAGMMNNNRPTPRRRRAPMKHAPPTSQQVQQVKYADNVRNRNRSNQQQMVPPTSQHALPIPQTAPQQQTTGGENLTIKALAAAPEEQKKQMIGERLFPLIKGQQPQLAGKITGMLLEMDNGELLHLLESPEALGGKIQEALQVLHEHEQNA